MSVRTFNLYLDMASGKEHSFVINTEKLQEVIRATLTNPAPFVVLNNDFDGITINFSMVEAFTYKVNEYS